MPPALVPVRMAVTAQSSSNGLSEHYISPLLAPTDGLCSTLAVSVDDVDGTVGLEQERQSER